MNVSDGRILCARISRHHHVAFFFRLHQLLSDVALHDLMSKVPPQGVATQRFDFKALLQSQPARLEPDVHETGAREVSVGENRNHWNLRILPRQIGLRKYDILHRR
jgi:hypothetical protein